MFTIPDALRPFMPLQRLRHPPPVVAVVRLEGLIGRLSPLRGGLTITSVAPILERAFKLPRAAAVALVINSPGGSPVQSALIGRRIRALAAEHNKRVFTFAEDVAASGGYWLLVQGDEVYADACSIVGSIGVISAGFGFPELLKRVGVERRVYTAGAHKDAFDPFQPEKPEDVAHLRRLQQDLHEAFCDEVRTRRGDKVREEETELFSGRFWSGRAAQALGLIDDLGDVGSVMRARFGDKVKLVVIGQSRPWWRRSLGWTGRPEAIARATESATASLLDGINERLMRSRYGL
jgi:serine protease SohB